MILLSIFITFNQIDIRWLVLNPMKFTGYSDLLKIYLKYKLLIITFIINKITQMAVQNDPNYR